MIKPVTTLLTETVQNPIEDRLQILLKPVTPDPDFIGQLESRLSHEPEVILEKRFRQEIFLFMAIGLFCSVWMIWFIRRLWR